MATKLYWITLRVVLDSTRRYMQRNQLKLQQNLDAPVYACVVSTLQAIIDCLALLPDNTPI